MSERIPSQPISISVSLIVNRKPPVMVEPPIFPVEGKPMKITWIKADKSEDFRFPDNALDIHGKSDGFSHPEAQDHHTAFSVFDEYTAKGQFTYTLTVEHKGKPYTTKITDPGEDGGDPSIHNK